MTHEQQLQQLLTEAEQVTAKMREALAKEAGEWLIANHTEPFLVFYGVE